MEQWTLRDCANAVHCSIGLGERGLYFCLSSEEGLTEAKQHQYNGDEREV